VAPSWRSRSSGSHPSALARPCACPSYGMPYCYLPGLEAWVLEITSSRARQMCSWTDAGQPGNFPALAAHYVPETCDPPLPRFMRRVRTFNRLQVPA